MFQDTTTALKRSHTVLSSHGFSRHSYVLVFGLLGFSAFISNSIIILNQLHELLRFLPNCHTIKHEVIGNIISLSMTEPH